jgi:hypothetical protein
MAIRVSWDNCDPGGIGKEGCDSYLDNQIMPGELIQRKIKNHTFVQVWAWGEKGIQVDFVNLPLGEVLTCSTAQPEQKLYQDILLCVIRYNSELIVENIFQVNVAIRISWDKGDPWCTGGGEDSYIDNWVTPGEVIQREIKYHTSTQICVWGENGKLIDSVDLKL